MARKLNILVIYVMNKYPMRATLWDQLYCFRHYSDHNCFYLNLETRSVPWYLKYIEFDLIVFGTIFLASRVRDEWFAPMLEKARALKSIKAIRIAFPQDEHNKTDILLDFLEEFDVSAVFSVGPPSEWPKLYDRIDTSTVKLYNVLTGYLNDATIARINKLAMGAEHRDIDIGYRTWLAGPWLGRHGLLRQKIADLFEEKARERGFTTNISTRTEDTLWGDDWYKFLLRCNYTISVEGGSSVPDRDGTLRERIEAYQREHPQADFAEVERHCFRGLDGTIHYVALSPKHLECCATRTCQVLVEGHYNGILQPGRHFIELKQDFSNIEQVLDQMQRPAIRQEIVERAYQDIVASGKYTYQRFVTFVLEQSLKERAPETAAPARPFLATVFYYWMRLSELVSWGQMVLHLHDFIPRLKGIVRRMLLGVFSEQTLVLMIGRVKASERKN